MPLYDDNAEGAIVLYNSPRFTVNAEGQVIATCYVNDNCNLAIAAMVNLGDATMLAADVAERGLRQEYYASKEEAPAAMRSMQNQLKRIRKALGLTY